MIYDVICDMILPRSQGKTKKENQPFTQLYSDGDRTREDHSLLAFFQIIQSTECVCANGDQTVDHLIFYCPKLDKEGEKLIAYTSREEDWQCGIVT
jgi:hypothetical protein